MDYKFRIYTDRSGKCWYKHGRQKVFVPMGKLLVDYILNIPLNHLPLYVDVYLYLLSQKKWFTARQIRQRFLLTTKTTKYIIGQMRKYELIEVDKVNPSLNYYRAKLR